MESKKPVVKLLQTKQTGACAQCGGLCDTGAKLPNGTRQMLCSARCAEKFLAPEKEHFCYECGKKCKNMFRLQDGCAVAACSNDCIQKIKQEESASRVSIQNSVGIGNESVEKIGQAKEAGKDLKEGAKEVAGKAKESSEKAKEGLKKGLGSLKKRVSKRKDGVSKEEKKEKDGVSKEEKKEKVEEEKEEEKSDEQKKEKVEKVEEEKSDEQKEEKIEDEKKEKMKPSLEEEMMMRMEREKWLDLNRALWQDHVWWTREVVIARIALALSTESQRARSQKALDVAIDRLLNRNQEDIAVLGAGTFLGNADAGETLKKLLQEHILGAAKILDEVAKLESLPPMDVIKKGILGGDLKERAVTSNRLVVRLSNIDRKDKLSLSDIKPFGTLLDLIEEWYENGDQIAEFLIAIDKDQFPKEPIESAMNVHLGQTILYAMTYLSGDFEASSKYMDSAVLHITRMSDVIASGLWNVAGDGAVEGLKRSLTAFESKRSEYGDDYTV